MKRNHSLARGAIRLLPCLFLALPIPAQAQDGDSLRAAVAARHQEAVRAAEIFLDRSRPADQRIAAVRLAETFLMPEQRTRAAVVARDAREEPEVRAAALLGLLHVIEEDDSLVADVSAWLPSPRTPPVLRAAAMTVIENLMFSQGAHAPAELLAALRATASDRDPTLRERALSALALAGDEATLARLREGLRSPGGGSLLPASRAVELLGLNLTDSTLAVLHQVMIEPPDAAARVAAIRFLGGYAPSRPLLVRYLQDPREVEPVRMTAMGALHAGAPGEFPGYALPIIEDEAASDILRVYAIRAVQYRRPRTRTAESGDSFDHAVARLATGSRSDTVRRAAAEYKSRRGI
jgi:hypothetical protein